MFKRKLKTPPLSEKMTLMLLASGEKKQFIWSFDRKFFRLACWFGLLFLLLAFLLIRRHLNLCYQQRLLLSQIHQAENILQSAYHLEEKLMRLNAHLEETSLDLDKIESHLQHLGLPSPNLTQKELSLRSQDLEGKGQGSLPSLKFVQTLFKKSDDGFKKVQAQLNFFEEKTLKILSYFQHSNQIWKSFPSVLPVKGRLSSGYGFRRNPLSNAGVGGHGFNRFHSGIDLAAPSGTKVQAPGDGLVYEIGTSRSYGHYLILSHGNHIFTRYAHLLRRPSSLHQGQFVNQGDVIALVGSSGFSTGPHLHYEVIVNGRPRNPLLFVKKDASLVQKFVARND